MEELIPLEVFNKDFALFHMTIRCLSLHYEEFHAFLCSLKIDFQFIGLSEIKASVNAPIKSAIFNLPGYILYQTVSHSAAGRVRIFC